MSIWNKIHDVTPKKEDKKERRHKLLWIRSANIRWLMILLFIVLIMILIPIEERQVAFQYRVGEPWRYNDLVASKSFAILKPLDVVENEKNEIRINTLPIFNLLPDEISKSYQELDLIFNPLENLYTTYQTLQFDRRIQSSSITSDSIQYVQQKNIFLEKNMIFNVDEIMLYTYNTQLSGTENTVIKDMKTSVRNVLEQLYTKNILNQKKEEMRHNLFYMRNNQDNTEVRLNKYDVIDVEEARSLLESTLLNLWQGKFSSFVSYLGIVLIKPNLIYDVVGTQALQDAAINNVSTVQGAISKDQTIIRRGDVITEETALIIQSLQKEYVENVSFFEKIYYILGMFLIISTIVYFFMLYIMKYRRDIYHNNGFLMLSLLSILLICFFSNITHYYGLPYYTNPVAIAPIILTLIFGVQMGLMSAIMLALILGMGYIGDITYVVSIVLCSTLAVLTLSDIKNRSQIFFLTPGIVFITQAIVVFGNFLYREQQWQEFSDQLLYVGIGSLFVVFSYPLVLLFEKIFKVVTDMTLIELNNSNHALLQHLLRKASGTFSHSLQVANLAESAATTIHANSLLCRVGALYHDVGKLKHPSFYSENQIQVNHHDRLDPYESARIIKSHITDGIELAKKYKLPDKIIDFIRTHHGTTKIQVFYQKAVIKYGEKNINMKDFCYKGPLPRTTEMGIVMLADSVEAASRSLKDVSIEGLYKLVDELFMERIQAKQLEKCPLTLAQLSIIKDEFVRILMGTYHGRVDYDDPFEKAPKKRKVYRPMANAKQQLITDNMHRN